MTAPWLETDVNAPEPEELTPPLTPAGWVAVPGASDAADPADPSATPADPYLTPAEPYASPAAPYATPARPHHRGAIALAGVGALALASVVGVGGLRVLDRAHTMLASASLPTAGTVGSAAPVSNGSPQASAQAITPAVVDIVSTLGYAGARAAGTGIVLTSDGLVLTNNHVVDGSTALSATDVGNGRTYKADVVGYDKAHDVAVVRLENASGLTTASMGDSSALKVGDTVVGVGNAGGVGGQPSSAVGQVLQLGASITASDESSGEAEQLTGMIATDAPIQPGDSGGPLVDTSGRVVGMDTAGSTDSGSSGSGLSSGSAIGNGDGSGLGFGDGSGNWWGDGSNDPFSGLGGSGTDQGGQGDNGQGSSGQGGSDQATGFAVPINTALDIAHQIVAGDTSSGTVHVGGTAFLGVQVAAGDGGVQVAGVVDGTPAAQAGLAQGDVITAVDGHSVDSPDTLGSVLAASHPGDQVSLTWTGQDGQQHTATVQLGSGPAA